MLFRLAYLGVTNARALLRVLPMSDPVLERHLHGEKIRFTPADLAVVT